MADVMDARTPHEALTERERDILRLLARGLSDSEIAEAMVLTVGTVKWYNRQIYGKLGVRNRAGAAIEAGRLGLLESAKPPRAGVTADAPIPNNLPAPLNSFIGRESERETLRRLLGVTRLLTLTGAPGTGKTRLAQEIAREVMPHFPDGVFSVSLAPISDAALVPSSIARTLGLSEQGAEELPDLLKRYLRGRSFLLVLDNFEHVLAAAPWLAELLASTPALRVLATSREALRVYGEYEYPVPPLALPDLKLASPENIRSCEAVTLFMQRAQATAPAFTLDDDNAASVAAICVHLDGLPLAIELAAARAKFYAPQTLLVRLGSRLEMLNCGPRDLPARQRTLRSTLAWSYDLLDAPERTLFARVGVFAGGFTAEGVRAVCGDGLDLDTDRGLESLLNKSLIRLPPPEAGQTQAIRFMMLETMREYALEKLAASGDLDFVRARHALYFLDMGERAAAAYRGPDDQTWVALIETEHDNLRVALRWCIGADQAGEMGLRFVASLAYFWETRGYLAEGRSWFAAVEQASSRRARTRVRAAALAGTADVAYLQCDYAATQALIEEALAIYRELGDQRSVAMCLISLGEVATEVGDYATAPDLFEQAYAMISTFQDPLGNARALTQLGYGTLRVGDLDRAQARLEEGCALYRSVGHRLGVALAQSGLGEIAIRRGDLAAAERLLDETLTLRRQLGHKWGMGVSLGSLAWVAILQGNKAHAVQLLGESLALRQEIGDPGGMAWCLEKLAEMAWGNGDPARAARILGAAQEMRVRVNSVVDPSDQDHYDALVRALHDALGPDLYEALRGEGAAMNAEQAIAFALEISHSSTNE